MERISALESNFSPLAKEAGLKDRVLKFGEYCKRKLCHFNPYLSLSWWRRWRTLPVYSWIRAAQAFRAGDFRQAARYYEKGLKRHGRHIASCSAELDLAYCLYRNGDLSKAVSHLYQALQGNYSRKESYLLLIKIQLILGNRNLAERLIKSARQEFPMDIDLMVQYAHVLLKNDVRGDDFRVIREELLLKKDELEINDPAILDIDTVLARYEYIVGNSSYGEQLLARVIATGQAPLEAIVLRGSWFLENGRLLSARELCRRAMIRDPRDVRPPMMLAQSYLVSMDKDEHIWGKELAELACRLSNYRNIECLSVLEEAFRLLQDPASADLIRQRAYEIRLRAVSVGSRKPRNEFHSA